MNKKSYLLVLPGWSTDQSVFSTINDELSKYFEIIFLNWDSVETINSFRKKVEYEILKNEIEKISILGWSLGALISLEFTHLFPELVDKLILISATSRFTTDGESNYSYGWDLRIIKRMKKNLLNNPRKTLVDFYNSMYSESEIKSGYETNNFKLIKSEHISQKEIEELIVGLDYLIDRDLRDIIKDFKTPTLIIHGDNDIVCPLEASEYIMTSNKSFFTLKRLNNCGHIPFITRPQECLKYIKEFI